eukprot:UN00739
MRTCAIRDRIQLIKQLFCLSRHFQGLSNSQLSRFDVYVSQR